MSSSIITITVACPKHKANIDLINLLGLDYVENGETVLIEIMGIGDSGADTGVEISEVRQIIGDQRLSDASCLLKGATGTSNDLARNILSIVKENGAIVNIDTRKVEDLGVNGSINDCYESGVKEEFGLTKETEKLFEFRKKSSKIGLESGSLLGKQIEPDSLGLKKPICSPHIII